MKIVVISGSMRADSQSRKVSEYLMGRLQEFGAETMLIDLYEQKLPFYDDTSEGPWQSTWDPIAAQLAMADGFVMVSPEWDGMFSAGLHNMFNYVASASPHVMAHKPVTLVGVSDGMGGVYPLAQMRMVGPKNTQFMVSSVNLRFARVEEVLVDGRILAKGLQERADYSMKVLIELSKSLQQFRNSGVIDLEKFPTGV